MITKIILSKINPKYPPTKRTIPIATNEIMLYVFYIHWSLAIAFI